MFSVSAGTTLVPLKATAFAALVLLLTGDFAAAAGRSRVAGERFEKASMVAAPFNAPAAGPLMGVVSINRQTVTFFSGTERIAEAPISSGQPGHRTPTGVFSIIQKARYHESNIYSGAPMPFMQRLTWSGIALHAGNLPGYPASHGCIRMPYDFAERLFGMTRMGVRVVVAAEPVAPAPITHERLPTPKFTEVSDPVPAPLVTASVATGAMPTLVASAAAAPSAGISLLSPRSAADHEKVRAARAVVDWQRQAKDALHMSSAASATAESAKRGIAAGDAIVKELRQRLQRAEMILAQAISEEDRTQAFASVAVIEEDLTEAVHMAAATRHAETQAADHALDMAVAARKAEDAAIAAEQQVRVAARGTEPLSVFVSRKDNRVYLRQGLTALMEGDVSIDDITAPIGTHVFTVIGANETGSDVSWSALTLPETASPAVSARAALDRITFAPKLADEIARRIWPGASVIVSDHPISGETGLGTDFIVLTK